MKTLLKFSFVFLAVLAFTGKMMAQSTREEKQAAKTAAIKKMVDSNKYVFVANFAIPQRGGQKNLSGDYDLKVLPDTIIAYLPYYGRSHMAPTDLSGDGGIKFKSSNFSYKTVRKDNGSWQITIKPKDSNIGDWRDVQQLYLNISTSGYASLQITSSNRDPISYQGYIESVKKQK